MQMFVWAVRKEISFSSVEDDFKAVCSFKSFMHLKGQSGVVIKSTQSTALPLYHHEIINDSREATRNLLV